MPFSSYDYNLFDQYAYIVCTVLIGFTSTISATGADCTDNSTIPLDAGASVFMWVMVFSVRYPGFLVAVLHSLSLSVFFIFCLFVCLSMSGHYPCDYLLTCASLS